jgi:hypothetical protein
MLDGPDQASTSSSAVGETFQFKCFQRTIRDRKFNVYDTIGLNEGSQGKAAMPASIASLWGLLKSLENGVSLLVYVMTGRITELAKNNYSMFYETFCGGGVPIVVVVTKTENVEDIEQWWMDNEKSFDNYRMRFAGHACITAIKGRDGMYHAEYERSKFEVEGLIASCCGINPWKMQEQSWFRRVVMGFLKYGMTDFDSQVLYKALIDIGMKKKEAKDVVKRASEAEKRAAKK